MPDCWLVHKIKMIPQKYSGRIGRGVKFTPAPRHSRHKKVTLETVDCHMVGFQTPPPPFLALSHCKLSGFQAETFHSQRQVGEVVSSHYRRLAAQSIKGYTQEQRGGRGLCCLEDSFHLEVQTRDATTNTATEYNGKGEKNDSAV